MLIVVADSIYTILCIRIYWRRFSSVTKRKFKQLTRNIYRRLPRNPEAFASGFQDSRWQIFIKLRHKVIDLSDCNQDGSGKRIQRVRLGSCLWCPWLHKSYKYDINRNKEHNITFKQTFAKEYYILQTFTKSQLRLVILPLSLRYRGKKREREP